MIAACDLLEHMRRVFRIEDEGYRELQYDSARQDNIQQQLMALKDSGGEPLGSIMLRVLPVWAAFFDGDPKELHRQIDEHWDDIDRFRTNLRTLI